MLTENERKQILVESFSIILPKYKDCHYQLSKAVGLMFGLDVDLAAKMWESFIKQNEAELLNEDDASDILINRIIELAFETAPISVIARKIEASEYISRTVFGLNRNLGRSTASIVNFFIKEKEIWTAASLIEYVLSEPKGNISSLDEFFYYIIKQMELDEYEANRQMLQQILIRMNVNGNDFRMISIAIMQKKIEWVKNSPLTQKLIQSITSKDFFLADETFRDISSSGTYNIDYLFYRVIQSIKIDDWMECDKYVINLLCRSGLSTYSDQLQKVIDRKNSLKEGRLKKSVIRGEKNVKK